MKKTGTLVFFLQILLGSPTGNLQSQIDTLSIKTMAGPIYDARNPTTTTEFKLQPSLHRISIDRGFIIPHHDDLYHLYQNTLSVQYQYLRNVLESNSKLGISAYAADLGSATLGWGASLGLNLEQVLYKASKVHAYWGFIMGIGYISNPYDVVNNSRNRAIGTHGNAFGQLYLGGSQKLYNGITLDLNLRFSHFSNGAWKAPNLGINMPTVSLGISKKIKTNPIITQPLQRAVWSPFGSLRLGGKSLDIDDTRLFLIPVMELGISYSMSGSARLRFALAAQADPFYRFQKFEPISPFTFSNGVDLGISVGYHKRWGAWGMLADLGWYVYKPSRGYKTPYFEALGMTYEVDRNFTLIGRLKANKTTADLIEWGVVYHLK